MTSTNHRECDDTCTFDCGRCKGRVKRRLIIDIEVPKNNPYLILHYPTELPDFLRGAALVVTTIRNEPRD